MKRDEGAGVSPGEREKDVGEEGRKVLEGQLWREGVEQRGERISVP